MRVISPVIRRPVSGLFVFTASDGQKYATKSEWMASLAKQAHEQKFEVEILSVGGWFYRDVLRIARAAEVA